MNEVVEIAEQMDEHHIPTSTPKGRFIRVPPAIERLSPAARQSNNAEVVVIGRQK